MLPAELQRRLAAGEFVSDLAFDAHLPEPLRRASRRFWTPVEVARRVAWWLALAGARRVLDIGSGAGKFCVAAAMTSDLELVGVERRVHLVMAASDLARRFRVDARARFLCGEPDACLVRTFDALYLFNPFEENLFDHSGRLDDTVEMGPERYLREVAEVEAMLASVAPGTHLVTYNGFGGRISGAFDLVDRCSMHGAALRMWIKTDRPRGGRWWHEHAMRESVEKDP